MRFFLKVLVSAIAVVISAYFFRGIVVADFTTAIVVAFVLAILNAILKPVLIILTIPFTIMSLGLFLLVINALIIQLAAYIVRGFDVAGFWPALFFAIILSLVTWLLELPVRPRPPRNRHYNDTDWH